MLRSAHRLLLVFVMGFVVIAPSVALAQPGLSRLQQVTPISDLPTDGMISTAWNFFLRLWNKGGCLIDPSGVAAPSTQTTPPASGDGGCLIDPSGLCVSSLPQPAPGEAGCGIDPSGHC